MLTRRGAPKPTGLPNHTAKLPSLVIAIDDPILRSKAIGTIRDAGLEPTVLHSTSNLFNPQINGDILILNTLDDVAALNQCVYHFRLENDQARFPYIIAIVHENVVVANPKLMGWTIRSLAALTTLLCPETTGWETMLRNMVSRLTIEQTSIS